MRDTNHYQTGLKAAVKLPKRLQSHPVAYQNDIWQAAYRYEEKKAKPDYDFRRDGSVASEFHDGLWDALVRGGARQYGVFPHQGTRRVSGK